MTAPLPVGCGMPGERQQRGPRTNEKIMAQMVSFRARGPTLEVVRVVDLYDLVTRSTISVRSDIPNTVCMNVV